MLVVFHILLASYNIISPRSLCYPLLVRAIFIPRHWPDSGGGGNVTDWDSRWFCVLIFCNYYECVLIIARKWNNVVAIFFCGPSVTVTQRQS